MISCPCCFEAPSSPGHRPPPLMKCACGRFLAEEEDDGTISWWFRYGKNPDYYDCPAIRLAPDGALLCYPRGCGDIDFPLFPQELAEVMEAASDRAGFGSHLASSLLES